jgi:acetyltransferase-like isoleucine patch superfamily enzyme
MSRGRSFAGNLLRAGRRGVGWLKTSQARREAVLGPRSRFMHTADLHNLPRIKDRITVGCDTVIAGQLHTFSHAGRIVIGDWVFVGAGSRIWCSAEISIGDRTLISHDVEIHDTETHPLDPVLRAKQARVILTAGHLAGAFNTSDNVRCAPIRIGSDVWIGFGATIRKGVSIGDRTIIGARCIVDCDIPADSILKAPGTRLQ